MPVIYNVDTKIFHLYNDTISYLMTVSYKNLVIYLYLAGPSVAVFLKGRKKIEKLPKISIRNGLTMIK